MRRGELQAMWDKGAAAMIAHRQCVRVEGYVHLTVYRPTHELRLAGDLTVSRVVRVADDEQGEASDA